MDNIDIGGNSEPPQQRAYGVQNQKCVGIKCSWQKKGRRKIAI